MKKKKYIKILLIIIAFIGLLLGILFIRYNFFRPYEIKHELAQIDLKKYNNLMIVAHPDDEMLWGGNELIHKNYVVVCVTCGPNKIRANEFKNVMKKTNDKYIMLGYPDKIFFKRSNWTLSYNYIKKDLKEIESYYNWNMIVTHNKHGEYGHIHHKMVHNLVMSTADKNKVYVFGKYCSPKGVDNGKCTIDNQLNNEFLSKEKSILKLYKSQKRVIKYFNFFLPYAAVNKVTK